MQVANIFVLKCDPQLGHIHPHHYISIRQRISFNFQPVENNQRSSSISSLSSVPDKDPSPSPSAPAISSDDDLPEGWEARKTKDGRTFYVDHNTHTTTWEHPRVVRSRSVSASFVKDLGPLPVRKIKQCSFSLKKLAPLISICVLCKQPQYSANVITQICYKLLYSWKFLPRDSEIFRLFPPAVVGKIYSATLCL